MQKITAQKPDLQFLLDVDDTLLNNDQVKADIGAALTRMLGEKGAQRFWEFYEQVRQEYDVVDYPQTLKRFTESWQDKKAARQAADLINNWPYDRYLYPGTLSAIRCIAQLGRVDIVSDGDADYQSRKIARSELEEAVGGPGHVHIYIHKEGSFPDLMSKLPARHYVLVDDKEPILAHAKQLEDGLFTTVWVKQGHYANDPAQYAKPDPDITLDNISQLCDLGRDDFLGGSKPKVK